MCGRALLHHFDKSLTADLRMSDFIARPERPISRQLVRMALNTCFDSDVGTPEIREGYMSRHNNDSWSFLVQADCSVPPDEDDPQVVYFQSKQELDDDGNVEFVPVVPRTAKARRRYHAFLNWKDEEGTDPEPDT